MYTFYHTPRAMSRAIIIVNQTLTIGAGPLMLSGTVEHPEPWENVNHSLTIKACFYIKLCYNCIIKQRGDKMYIYNDVKFSTLEEAKEALMVDFPGALDDELCDLFDLYIGEE